MTTAPSHGTSVYPIRFDERIKREVRIIWEPRPDGMDQWPPLPWARECTSSHVAFFRRNSSLLLIARSVCSRGRIVRAWYLRNADPFCDAYNPSKEGACPIEAAWLASLQPCCASLPAWQFLQPDQQQ